MYKMTVKNIRKMLLGPKVTDRISFERIRFDLHDDNAILFNLDDTKIDWFHSVAYAGKMPADFSALLMEQYITGRLSEASEAKATHIQEQRISYGDTTR
jgi:hypothetical protein